MNKLLKIINEEIKQCLKESEDFDYDLFEKLDEIRSQILSDFLRHKQMGIKSQPWKVVPFARLKKIWEDYIRLGFVRDEKGLDLIEAIIQNNILKLYANTELVGHTSSNPDEYFDEYEYSEEDKNDFYDYIDKYTDYGFDDFGGRRLGLITLLMQLRRATTPEQRLVIIDQILNVTHWTSDLAAWFVEGGSSSLAQLSGSEANPK